MKLGSSHAYDLESQHVLARNAIAKGPRPARALGHVAAERAEPQRGWIRGVEKPFVLDQGLKLARNNAGLDHRQQRLSVDLFDLLHPLGGQDDTPGHR